MRKVNRNLILTVKTAKIISYLHLTGAKKGFKKDLIEEAVVAYYGDLSEKYDQMNGQ